ncbi:hypothetical protein DSM106972_028710 [Dulcicalothrix desertica PCC 7102]|uniref:Uncharacterized protein n=1 Tax=Dulcicalothrix desertica PCC 7102 TaxID=232991 RepID=A0A433VKH8_9CYAN|nr:hypothetical protein DSM106972_028710 [Dulcicalothrix desertica PCC 7102]
MDFRYCSTFAVVAGSGFSGATIKGIGFFIGATALTTPFNAEDAFESELEEHPLTSASRLQDSAVVKQRIFCMITELVDSGNI